MKTDRIHILSLTLLLLASPVAARADDPQIYLTWHAPFGQPGATDTLSASADTTRADTLWLSFDSGKPSPTFIGFNGTLVFHPAAGDTLAPWWRQNLGKSAPPQIDVMFPPRPDIRYRQPFHMGGAGGTRWDMVKDEARLRFIYAIPFSAASALPRGTYVAMRVIVRRPPPSEPGATNPVCIEWSEAEIAYDVGPERAFARTGAHRFVSLNSPGGAVAVPYRAVARRIWRPKDQ